MKKYIDLGLPSGTLWADTNEDDYFIFDEAKEKFGDTVPTIDEWKELKTKCTWTWTTQNGVNGRLVTGPNGNSIFLPAAGYRHDTFQYNVGSYGLFWSSSLNTGDPSRACCVYFYSYCVYWGYRLRYYGLSIRLVKRK